MRVVSSEKMTEIIKTADGSDTIYVPEMDEHYHSVYGAVSESRHIFINSGFMFCESGTVRIFEAGFGTGLNAFLTAQAAISSGREVFYTSVEKYPLQESIIKSLNYNELIPCGRLFELIHSCKWNEPVRLCSNFTLTKLKADLITDEITGEYEVVYFDAFGPEKQPEIWSREVFRKISDVMLAGSILVTYSVKGDVKRLLKESGFSIELLPGPKGKRHIMRAVKI